MTKPYPLLISIPHGGDTIPPEVEDKLRLGKHELIEDSDAFTKTLYHLEGTALRIVSTDILRAVVDPNRPPDDLPPANPDGVVKSHTCYNKKIYKDHYHKDAHLIDRLLSKYYDDFHQRIRQAIRHPGIDIAFDCHSMAAEAPAIAPDPGSKRPVITLGDNYGKACDPAVTRMLAEAFLEVFNLEKEHLTINKPFAGGYITRKYGNAPIPWIQIEMNRCLYLDERWFDRVKMEINENRLIVLRKQFERVVEVFFGRFGKK